MCKSIIYQALLERVERETEIPRERILSGEKQTDVVEARCLLFHFMQKAGFYPSQIARTTGCSRQSVNKLLNGFADRCDTPGRGKMLSIFLRHLGDELAASDLI